MARGGYTSGPMRPGDLRLSSLVVLALIAAGGCAAPVAPGKPYGDPPESARVPADRYAAAFDAAVAALRDAGFRLDRVDERFGRITTAPAFVATALEPWHGRIAHAARAGESTLNQQRRRARVRFDRVGSGAVRMTVAVRLEQRRRPGLHLTGSGRPGRMRAGYRRPAERRDDGPVARSVWRAAGREPHWERRLRERILARVVAEGAATRPAPRKENP